MNVVDYADKSMARNPRVRVEGDALVESFRLRGVPDEQIVYLRDDSATGKRIRAEFDDFLWHGVTPRAGIRDLLFFHFSGHGNRSKDGSGRAWYCPYDYQNSKDGWPVSDILDRIDQRFGGNRVIFTAACCYSGSVAELLSTRLLRRSYTVLASTLANTTSTHSWAFTRCLRDGFGGESLVDLDADGNVTLAELGRHATAEMRSIAQQQVTFGTFGRPGRFIDDLVLASKSPMEIASAQVAGLSSGIQLVLPRVSVARYSTTALEAEISTNAAGRLPMVVGRPQSASPTRARVADFGVATVAATGRTRRAFL